jgi:tetratricopeptide (TPR) repeat protein
MKPRAAGRARCRRMGGGALLVVVVAAVVACGGPEERKARYFKAGEELYEKGDYRRAILEFKNALQVDPNFARAYQRLGMAQLRSKDVRSAYAALSKAVELDPNLLDAQASLGQLLLAAGQTERAKAKAELVLGKDPEHPEALLLKAAYLLADNRPHAEEILKGLIDKRPDRPEPYLLLAAARVKQGDPAGARKVLADLLARKPDSTEARLRLAALFERDKRLDEAEREYRALLEREPKSEGIRVLLAQFYGRAGRDEQARQTLEGLIADEPKDVRFRLLLAEYYRSKKQDAEMEKTLQEALEAFPEDYGPREMLARYYVAQGQQDKAFQLVQDFVGKVRSGPGLPEARLMLASLYRGEGKDAQAMDQAEKLLQESPADARAHGLKGDLLATKGDYAGAIAEYRLVLRDEPQNTAVMLGLAKAHLLNHELALAEDTYKKVLEKKPDLREARVGLAEVYRRRGRLDDAARELKPLVEADRDDRGALAALGDLALARKDVAAAKEYVSRLQALEPASAPVLYRSGLVQLAEGKSGDAFVLFEKALEVDPDFAPALGQMLDAWVQHKQIAEAIERCRKQSELRPKNALYRVYLAKLHAMNKETDQARAILIETVEKNPDDLEALFELGRLEQSTGSLDAAIQAYRRIQEKNPKAKGITLLLGTLYEQQKRYDQAKALYQEVLAEKPDSVVAANNLAFLYAEVDPTKATLGKAEELVLPLLGKYSGNATIVDTGAWVHYRLGNYEKARDMLLSLQDKDRAAPIVRYHLGMAYARLGEKESARANLKRAVESGEDFPGRADAQKELGRL